MTSRQWRAVRMLIAGVILVLIGTVSPQPMGLVLTIAGFCAVVMA